MKASVILSIFNFLIIFSSCSSKPVSNVSDSIVPSNNPDKIEVYYFHFTMRCVTCLTLEAKTKEFVEALYPTHVRAGLITFQALNLDEESTKTVAKRLGVMGQTFLIFKGDKKVDITTEGFLYSMIKPDKFREIINEKIDGLLIR